MNKILKLAIQTALMSDDNYMIGAVVHNKSKVYSSGFNCSEKTHPEAQTVCHTDGVYNRGHHAEMSALMKIRHYELSNMELTVVRISRENGSICLSKPCKNCMELIDQFDIKKIHYTDGFGNLITISRHNPRIIENDIIQFSKSIWADRFCK